MIPEAMILGGCILAAGCVVALGLITLAEAVRGCSESPKECGK